MKTTDVDRITDWIVRRGLEGAAGDRSAARILREGATRPGFRSSRALAIIDTLHPVHEGTVFRWRNDDVEEKATIQYGRTTEGAAAESWQRSPFYHLLQTGGEELRRRIGFGEAADFPIIQEMKDAGPHRLHRLRPSLCQRRRHRRDGLRLLGLVDARSRGLQRGRHRGPAPPRAGAGPRHQERRAAPRSPARWSRSISAATPAGACSRAASSAASPTASRRRCGSPTCAASPPSPTPPRRARSSRC